MQFTHPAFLLLLLLLAWLWRVGRHAPAPIGAASLWCRCAVAALLVLALAGLRVRVRDGQVTVIFVIDRSASLSPVAQGAAVARVNAMSNAMRSGDRAGIVVFGASAALERRAGPRADMTSVTAAVGDDATDIEGAVKAAANALPAEGLRRIVLLSDGRETRGNAVREAERAGAEGIHLDVAPIEDDPAARPPAIVRVSAPADVKGREPFAIVVDVAGPPGGRASVRLSREGQPPVMRDIAFSADGAGEAAFSDQLRDPGLYAYRAAISSDQAGANADASQQAVALVSVEGPSRVLYVADGRGALASLLAAAGFSVAAIVPAALPASASALLPYDEIVLDNVAPGLLTPAQAAAIASHVEETGGGLLVLGGAGSLNQADYGDSPLARALPIDLRPRAGTRAPAMALVLIFDKSGSMADRADGVPKIELARNAAIKVLDVLPKTDSLGVVAFDAAPVTIAPLGRPPDAAALAERLRAIEPGGSTAMAPPVKVALDWLRASPVDPSRRFILLISDGRSTPADVETLRAELRGAGVKVSAVAIGTDADRPMLESIARDTGGRAYFPDDARELPAIVARDAARSAGGGVVTEPFTLRSMPHSITSGLGSSPLPQLGGYVVSAAREGAETPLVSPQDDPILATWQFGLGRVGVFTSDLGSPWTASFHAWRGFGQLWAQSARWLARTGRTGGLRARMDETPSGARLIVEAESADGAFANGLAVRADVRSPRGDVRRMALDQTAPGRYEAAMPSSAGGGSGPYLVAVTARGEGSNEARLLRGFYRSADEERRATGVDRAALERIAAAGGGEVLTGSASPFDRARTAEFRDAWPWLALLALLLFLVDVAIRRGVRITGRAGSPA